MAKLLLLIATTDTPQPDGQVFSGRYLFTDDGAPTIETDVQHTTADLADGDHTFTAQAFDANSAPMGDQVTLTLTLKDGQIAAPTPPVPTTYPMPSALSATVVA